jgi:UDP-N-acetylmuramoyl-tripeptide--D-alanyl-D-alanine ligase
MLRLRANLISVPAGRIYSLLLCAAAFVWRTLLFRTTFIAITGSAGKTTAKECLAAILSSWRPSIATAGNSNGRIGIPRTILRARPWHRFCVVEVGTDRPGTMIRSALLVRPDIAVILGVGRAHSNEFRTLEDTAREKSRLLALLGRRGTAVLNGDDARVAAMAQGRRCRIVWFGSSPEFHLWASETNAEWPDRLRFRASAGEESCAVKTQLVGRHWVPSVMGALAAAQVCGVPLRRACASVESVSPFSCRMQPIALDNGAVLLRDECDGSYETMLAAFEVLRSARAKRRITVVGDCSDLRKKPRERMKRLSQLACECSEVAVFVGPSASHGARHALNWGLAPADVREFVNWEDAAEFLAGNLEAGDLVLIKGRASDHLSRIYFGMRGTVQCHRQKCSIRSNCDRCSKLGFVPRCDAAVPGRPPAQVR